MLHIVGCAGLFIVVSRVPIEGRQGCGTSGSAVCIMIGGRATPTAFNRKGDGGSG